MWQKSEWLQCDIEKIILNRWEESSNIDFKSGAALINNERARKSIAKDVSAFANSTGGIIIYGITEADHVAAELSFIDGRIITKEWIEQIITSNIQRTIKGLKIFPIRFDGNIKQSIYVVYIPDSNDKPHLSIDGKFYRRCNFESILMYEHEIRNLYQSKTNSELKIIEVKTLGISAIKPKDNDSLFWMLSKFNAYWHFCINIKNTGSYPIDSYKIVVTFNKKNKKLIPMLCDSNVNVTLLGEEKILLSPNHIQKLLPGEVYTAINFQVSGYGIRQMKPKDRPGVDFKISLFFEDREEQLEGNFRDIIMQSGCKP